jgi:hypothetical protein
MKKTILLIAVGGLLLVSCGSQRLYYWGSSSMFDKGTTRYENLAYRNYDQQSPESLCELICLYEDMVTNPGGTRGVVPPGICAEYGYLLLQPSTAEVFEQHATRNQRRHFSATSYGTLFASRGEEMLKKEMELYPESAAFIAPLLKKLTSK